MLPDGWTKEPIGDRVSIKHGFAFASSHFNLSGDGYRLLTPGHFAEEGGFRDIGDKQKFYSGSVPNGYLLKKNDLLVAMTEQAPGLLRSSLLVPEDDVYLHNQRLGLVQIRDDQRTSLNFLFHLFNASYVRKHISDAAGGTKVRHTSPDKITSVPALFPPRPQQERIAVIVDSWYRGIRQLSDLIAAKLRFKQGLMQQLLTGKRRFPEFKGEWKHEEIGHYLEECSSRVSAATTLPIYTSSRAGLKPQEDYYGGRKVINDGEYGVVPIDCFVFRHMSDDGLFVFHINQTGGDIAVSREHPVFRAINLDRHFLLAKLNHSPDFKTFASSQKAGGTRTRLYFSKLRNWKTLFPSLPEQRRISEALNAADREIDLLRRELYALKQQKKGLMLKLLTGQLRVPLPKGVA